MFKKNIKNFEFDIFLEFVKIKTYKFFLFEIKYLPCKYYV
jgi:hypothetical protein